MTVKPGQPVRLDDFRLPIADQQVHGIVVDSRGNPLPGVMVSCQRTNQSTPFYAPSGGRWFQDTDAAGRFRLNSLPRVPIKLMVYRRQDGGGLISGIRYVDVGPQQTEIRIEMPDENDRLRGVE